MASFASWWNAASRLLDEFLNRLAGGFVCALLSDAHGGRPDPTELSKSRQPHCRLAAVTRRRRVEMASFVGATDVGEAMRLMVFMVFALNSVVASFGDFRRRRSSPRSSIRSPSSGSWVHDRQRRHGVAAGRFGSRPPILGLQNRKSDQGMRAAARSTGLDLTGFGYGSGDDEC